MLGNNKHFQRNIMNDSELIKSWSENISNIMEFSLRDEEGWAPFSDKRHRSSVDEANRYYFTTKKRISTPNFKENIGFTQFKNHWNKENKYASSMQRNNSRNIKSNSQIDHSAEEIKESDIKPYNFITEKMQYEIMSKYVNTNKFKNKNENYKKILNNSQMKKNKYSSYEYSNQIDKAIKNERNDSVNLDSNEENIDIHDNSKENSEISHDSSKKNILVQENIIYPELQTLGLEEVREFDYEDNSLNSERKHV